MIRCTWLHVVLIFSGLFLTCLFQNSTLAQEVERFELALLENAKMLQSFDVLMRDEVASEEGLVTLVYTRLAIDWKQRLLFCLRTGRTRLNEADRKKNGGHEFLAFTELSISDGKACEWKRFPNSVSRGGDFATLTSRTSAPDIRMIGLNRFPTDMASSVYGFEHAVSQGAARYLASDTRHVKRKDGFLEQSGVPKKSSLGPGQAYARSISVWDPLEFVPVQCFSYIVLKGESKCISAQHIEWENRNGCYVPVSLMDEFPGNERHEDGTRSTNSRIVKFHYFQVNADLDRKLIDFKWLEDLGKVLELADPTKLNVGERLNP